MLCRHKLLLHCVPQIFELEYKRATNVCLYRVETALLVNQSNSDRRLAAIAWASCCLFSVEQRLATFVWALLPPFHNHHILLVAIIPFLSLLVSQFKT